MMIITTSTLQVYYCHYLAEYGYVAILLNVPEDRAYTKAIYGLQQRALLKMSKFLQLDENNLLLESRI